VPVFNRESGTSERHRDSGAQWMSECVRDGRGRAMPRHLKSLGRCLRGWRQRWSSRTTSFKAPQNTTALMLPTVSRCCAAERLPFANRLFGVHEEWTKALDRQHPQGRDRLQAILASPPNSSQTDVNTVGTARSRGEVPARGLPGRPDRVARRSHATASVGPGTTEWVPNVCSDLLQAFGSAITTIVRHGRQPA
jgi:hypothetical protein